MIERDSFSNILLLFFFLSPQTFVSYYDKESERKKR